MSPALPPVCPLLPSGSDLDVSREGWGRPQEARPGVWQVPSRICPGRDPQWHCQSVGATQTPAGHKPEAEPLPLPPRKIGGALLAPELESALGLPLGRMRALSPLQAGRVLAEPTWRR